MSFDRSKSYLRKDEAIKKNQSVTISVQDRATKRVIAPYVKIVRKSQKFSSEKVVENAQFSYYLQKKPEVLMKDLSTLMSDSVDLPSLLNETADVLKTITRATGVTLYMVDEAAGEIYQFQKKNANERHKVNWRIEEGKTVAAYVAFCKEFIMVDDILGDDRFLDGIGHKDETVKSVICVPVMTPDSDCLALMELYKDVSLPPFLKDDLKVVVAVTGWMGAALHQNQQRLALQRQQELNDYLLDLTKCCFADNVLIEMMIVEIVSFAKITLGAERGSFFILDNENDELVANLFDEEKRTDGSWHRKNMTMRIPKDKGIAGLVATTGQTVNIKDAYKDPRFNKEVDFKTGFITRSILCMPIMGVGGILGVVQVVNKKHGSCFTNQDINLFETFSVYGALALHYSNLHTLMTKLDLQNQVFHRVLLYHFKPCMHYIKEHKKKIDHYEVPEDFEEFFWYISVEQHPYMIEYVIYMFNVIIGSERLDQDNLLEFVLACRNSYRDIPYHNWYHGFNVCHCMYNILIRNGHLFTQTEKDALIVGTLGHDLDHGGFTNNFLALTNDTLHELYGKSPWENHHYKMTSLLLERFPIFKDYTEEGYKEMMDEIKAAILATDLASFFKAKAQLNACLAKNDGQFDWFDQQHRDLLKEIMMSTCDLSGQCKPYSVARKITESIYKEFYNQGDIEKSMGLSSLSMMDREKSHLVPEDQVGFLSIVVMPCTELLMMILPNCADCYNECKNLRDTWRETIDLRGHRCWRQEDSLPKTDND